MDTKKWPVKTCGRCGGTGRYSFNLMDGDRCYGCGGTQTVAASKTVAALIAEWNAIVKAGQRPTIANVAVGDKVVANFAARKDAGVAWATVTAIEITDKVCAWSGVERTPCAWYAQHHAGYRRDAGRHH